MFTYHIETIKLMDLFHGEGISRLNALGLQGWELVQVIHTGEDFHHVMKKALPAGATPVKKASAR